MIPMKDQLSFRKAAMEETDRIFQIILQAKEQMRRLNSRQWQDGYPAREDIVQDIKNGYGYVFCQDDTVVAYGAISFDGEGAYNSIDGKWLSDLPYVVVHRLAVADEMKQRGMATLFMREVESLSLNNRVYSFRVDTNFDNHYMHKMLDRLKFTYCGEIEFNHGRRMAYEKILNGGPFSKLE